MRLINVNTQQLVEFIGDDVPPYAILSHTWETEEVTYQDFIGKLNRQKKGWGKIHKTCEITRKNRLEYVWIDTSCIDKSSSAELSEAINSMYNWYKNSHICFAWLADWGEDESEGGDMRNCRWFKRGWTLQELIAPPRMLFFDKSWVNRGDKLTLLLPLHNATHIHIELLHGQKSLSNFTVAQKMSWAAKRRTTRKEDMAYSMLGIFDLNMPLLYGEGDRAFRRLQEAIITSSADLTIFAWSNSLPPTLANQDQNLNRSLVCGVLAQSVDDFRKCGDYESGVDGLREFSTSNLGIRIRMRMHLFSGLWPAKSFYVLPVACRGGTYLGIRVCQIGHDQYVREDPYDLHNYMNEIMVRSIPAVERFLLVKIPDELFPLDAPRQRLASTWSVLSRSRAYVLQFETEKNMMIIDPWPLHRYDHPDCAFIAPENARRDFGSIVLLASVTIPDHQEPSTVACQFHAFGWYEGRLERAQFGLIEYSHEDPDTSILQNWVETWDRSTSELIEALRRRNVPRQSEVLCTFPGSNHIALVSFKVTEQDEDKVCTHVYWKVKFSVAVYPNIHECPEVWKEEWDPIYPGIGPPL